MKKLTVLLLSLICITILTTGLVACAPTTYSLDDTNFQDVVEFQATITLPDLLANLEIVASTGDKTSTIAVTEDMVDLEKTDVSTTTVGEKKIVLNYMDNELVKTFYVKYKVEFKSEDVVIKTQHVQFANEIELPEDPTKLDYTFVYWTNEQGQEHDFSTTIDGNKVFTAKFIKNAVMQTGEIYTWENSGSIDFSQSIKEGREYSVSVKNAEQENLLNLSLDEENGLINYTFVDTTFTGDVTIVFVATEEGVAVVEEEHTIKKYAVPTATIQNDQVLVVELNTYPSLSILINSNVETTYDISVNNTNIRTSTYANVLMLTGVKSGVSIITLTVYNKHNPGEYIEVNKTIIVKPRDFSVTQLAENVNYGIEGLRTIGRTNADGGQSSFTLTYSLGNLQEVDSSFTNNVTWHSTNQKATINSNGVVTLSQATGAELVSFYATFNYQGVELSTAHYTMRCVFDGVNVYNYEDLYNATTQNKPVVLQENVVDDFGYINGQLDLTKYTEIASTYDTTYYKNVGKENTAKIKILLQFKNDVYGNGKTINAHNLTMGLLDSTNSLTDQSLFRGPLNFVSMTPSESSAISVKGQDNVCFAVYENVTLNNVQLVGATLTPDQDGNVDLTDLNYAGTTVEVFGDNVNVEYSRISNGRTVLRVFGDVADKQKVITLNIKNSVLSTAREFIIRMGTNCFVDGTFENPTPSIGQDNTAFPKQVAYEQMNSQQKALYDQTYIKTFVNVKNSVLKDAGIFAIGIDTHFAGPMLANGTQYANGAFYAEFIKDWKNLAKTSYGAKLTFEGDVRIYDWKPLNSVDSSTLIECPPDSEFADLLKFDVKELVSAVADQERFKQIVCTYENERYVHGGIAFFGGGKNYGVFEKENYTFHALSGYNVALAEIDKEFLEAAAGRESFYFLLHDNTGTFLPKNQQDLLQSNEAYSNIYSN
ncbi:MAG: InlB B-repeat-containing protein [Clostridia bacterium]|nr:InlB B-repeat-containing protein [Clostridia bacterium]